MCSTASRPRPGRGAGCCATSSRRCAPTPRRRRSGKPRWAAPGWRPNPAPQPGTPMPADSAPAPPTPQRVVVVDDEPDITGLVSYHLAKAGYRVMTVADGREALQLARDQRPDLVVLDLMLPVVSGYDVLAELRQREETRDVGVILLTARKEEADRIKGLSLGADDYLAKPFSPQELVLRVRAVLRRSGEQVLDEGQELVFDGLRLDPTARTVTAGGQPVALTAKEFDLLSFFARHPRQVFTRSQLLDAVWGQEFYGDPST